MPRRRFGARLILALATTLLAFALAAGGRAHAQAADWSITKTASPANYSAIGQTITYTYVITKITTGVGSDLHDITLTDDKLGAITCPATTIPGPGGGTLTCTATHTTTAADLNASNITNTATANGQISSDNIPLAQITANATVNNTATPSWTLSKTASPTTYSAAGQTISYSYALTNNGQISISAISITDDKAGAVSCPGTSLAAGASMNCTANYTITAADMNNGSVTNTATATGTPAIGTLAPATANATVNSTAIPSWTLSKVANPTTYTAAGQTINYTYTLTNTGNVSISNITVSDDKVTTVTCNATSLAIGASTTCSGNYTTTSADVTAGSVTNTATAHGTPAAGALADVTAQATVTYRVTSGSITIVKNASGGDNTFSFTSTVSGTSSFTLTTVSGTASRSFSSVTPGTYTFTETDLPLHWNLTALSCTGDTGGTATTVDLTNRSVSIGLDSGESITCTFTNTFDEAAHRDQTLQVIRRFLSHRMSLLLSEGPDRPRFLRRFPGSLWGGNNNSFASAAPFSFSGSSSGLNTHMVFSTSLAQIAQAQADNNTAEADMALAYAPQKAPRKMPLKALPRLAPEPGFDVWVEAHYLGFGSHLGNVDNKGHFGVLYLGADRPITPSVLLGALVQFDWTKESSSAAGSAVKGRGAMAGPYVSMRLAPNMFLDARAAWGRSRNDVDPFGQYTDKFSTNRWLAHAKLTGNWHWQGFRLTPSVALDYIQEHQRDYTDALGVAIPGQTASLGRLSFGPEIARRFIGADGTRYEPMVALTGQWDFKRPEVTALDGALVRGDAVRARAQAGLMVYKPSGLSMRLVGTYDGIGDSSLHAYGGQIWVNVPFQ